MERHEIAVGQPVIIYEGNHSRYMTDRRGTVTAVARVWITVQPDGHSSPYYARRFRLDTQTDGGDVAPARFYTLEQWAEWERHIAARDYLREQGISISHAGVWHRREAELADIIRAATESPMPDGPLGGTPAEARAGWAQAVDFLESLSETQGERERRMTREFIEAMNAAPNTPAEARTGTSDRVAAALADVAALRSIVIALGYGTADYADGLPALDRIEQALRAGGAA